MTTAILIDAGFVRALFRYEGIPYEPPYVRQVIKRIIKNVQKKNTEEPYRVVFFDSPAYAGVLQRPVSKKKFRYIEPVNQVLADIEQGQFDDLNVSLRKGHRLFSQWSLKRTVLKSKKDLERAINYGWSDQDYFPEISQKEVDGLIHGELFDIFWRKTADRIVLVSNDTDFVSSLSMIRTARSAQKSATPELSVVSFNYRDISTRLYCAIDNTCDVEFSKQSVEIVNEKAVPPTPRIVVGRRPNGHSHPEGPYPKGRGSRN